MINRRTEAVQSTRNWDLKEVNTSIFPVNSNTFFKIRRSLQAGLSAGVLIDERMDSERVYYSPNVFRFAVRQKIPIIFFAIRFQDGAVQLVFDPPPNPAHESLEEVHTRFTRFMQPRISKQLVPSKPHEAVGTDPEKPLDP